MIWFVYSLLVAFFESMKDVFSKRSLKNIDEYIVAWSFWFFSLPFLVPFLFFIGIPALGKEFWIALLVGGTLNAMTSILYMKAIKYSDLSLTVPMVALTPLFLLLASPLIVGEFTSPVGLIGVLLIVFGSYTLNIKHIRGGFLSPFKALLKEKGPKLMLLIAVIWSITSNLDKVGIQNSSPLFWAAALNTYISIIMFPVVLCKSRKNLKQISKIYKTLFPIGMFGAMTAIFQMMALTMTLVAYVISIKRTSTIMSVLFGYLIFKEKNIKERLLGVVIMVIGVLFITLS
jgi:drug/metabolite transporter (DMT)-like permease